MIGLGRTVRSVTTGRSAAGMDPIAARLGALDDEPAVARRRDRSAAPLPRRAVPLRRYGVTAGVVLTVSLLSLGAELSPLAFVLIMHHVADGVMETRNYDTLIGFALIFIVLVIMSGIFLGYRSTLMAAVAERFTLRLRADAMQAAVRNAVDTEPAEGQALLQDINTIQSFMRSNMPAIPFDMLAAMVPLGILFYLDVMLGYIGLAGIAIAIAMGFVMHAATGRAAMTARTRLNESSAELSGQLVHPDLVRGLGMLQASALRWQPRYDSALGSMEHLRTRSSAVEGIDSLIFNIYEMIIKAYVCYLLITHLATMGLLMAAIFLSGRMIGPFSALAGTWQAWAFALQSWRRIQDALGDYAPPAARPANPTAPPGLVLEDASFHPPGRPNPIIGDLTLRLAPGTVVTVEGPNGVGKSTLLRLILGLMPPTTGRALLDGQDTFHCDREEFGARIGYLPQDVQLLEGNVFHNIGRGPGASPDRVVAAARAAGAHEMVARLPMGYQTPSGRTSGLSAGQRRLVGLARALYGDPRLLVLDEPEVGLDGGARMALRTAVGSMRARGGIVVIVTHEPGTWRGATDLRLVLSAGGGWQVQPAESDDAESDAARRLPALAAPAQ